MFISSSIPWRLARQHQGRSRPSHAPAVRRRGTRLAIEQLEDRTVPSLFTVTSLGDSGAGSDLAGDLRYCINQANSTPGDDTITFAVTGTINLANPLPDLSTNIDIQGPGADHLTVERDPASAADFRIFAVGSTATVQISGLTISGGRAIDGNGGGIYNAGTLMVSYSTLFGNWAYNSDNGGEGGGIYNAGTLTVSYSTLSDNGADVFGGGIENSGTATVIASTFSDNYAYWEGGGLDNGGTLTLSNSTVYGNSVANDPWAFAGGIAITGPSTIITSSTIWGNPGGDVYITGGMGVPLEAGNSIIEEFVGSCTTDLGYNLIRYPRSGSGFAPTDLLNVDPLLAPLGWYGGPTQTMALLPGSPARDAGDNALAVDANGSPLAFDQRGPGFARIVGGTIDIGAFEVQGIGGLAVSGFPTTTTAGVAGSFTVTALNAEGGIDTAYTGTVHFTSSDAQAALPADYTFQAADAGVHTFSATLKTAGTQWITATDTTTAGLTGTDGGITVNPAAASKFIVTTAPTSVTAGTAFSLTLTVEDAYGNVATGYTGTVHFSSTDTTATLPADYTFTAGDEGVHTFAGLVLRKKGKQKITITDTPNRSLTTSVIVNVRRRGADPPLVASVAAPGSVIPSEGPSLADIRPGLLRRPSHTASIDALFAAFLPDRPAALWW